MKRSLLVVCLLLSLVALAWAPPAAYANTSPHVKANGTIVFGTNPPPLNVSSIGGYTVYTDNLSGALTGTIESSQFVFIRTLIIHSNGEFDVTGEITGAATIEGRSGGWTQRITGTGLKSTGALHGQWEILDGTGELAGLQGHGTFAGIAGQASDYSGMVWFEAN
jgi:hypothetical protein